MIRSKKWVIVVALTSSLAFAKEPGLTPLETQAVTQALKSNISKVSRESRKAGGFRKLFTYRNTKGRLIQVGNPTEAPVIWALKDPAASALEGTSTEKAYAELGLKEPAQPILVAVIDSGVEIEHTALKNKITLNTSESAGTTGVDDDHNGYVDDSVGWNFLGNQKGENINYSTLEVTREVKRLMDKQSAGGLTSEEQAYLKVVRADYDVQRNRVDGLMKRYDGYLSSYLAALEILRAEGLTEETVEAVKAIKTDTEIVNTSKTTLLIFLVQGIDSHVLKSIIEELEQTLRYQFDFDFDPSSVIGDDPKRLDDIGYGNSRVSFLGDDHGTHVSGIIAAERNEEGMEGQARWAKILPIRAVPNGDERDKDVANAVRYAVDSGARVINMSFGKAYSPHKDYVDAAFEYAESKGVLVVHAAGNEGADLDTSTSFPNPKTLSGKTFSNWLTVGASSMEKGKDLAAEFSNYGQANVDLFAPGVEIYSTVTGNKYDSYAGTSMASPEVAGVAALILSQFPELTPVQLKTIILQNVRKYPELSVIKPGATGMTPFETLSASGGIIDAYSTLKALGLKSLGVGQR